MKKFILFFFCLFSLSINAQDLVYFKLTPNGYFASDNDKEYIIVPFEDQNAHQIFQQLSVNVNSLYKNPSKVMSVIDDASISIRAFDDKITFIKDLVGKKFWLSGYYNLNFEIKDGRVKVSAPKIDKEMVRTINSLREKYFYELVKGWFKDGVVKEKSKKQVEYTEANMNLLINTILGKGQKQPEEDW